MSARVRGSPRTAVERAAARQAREIRTRLGNELRTVREDAGLSLSRLADACGLSKGHLHALEAGRIEPRTETVARVASVLGMSLSVRLYPGTGPLIRDHIQSVMIGALLRILHERWRPRPEVPVYRPVRGVIDLVLDDSASGAMVACEAQSELRRLEQQLRWSRLKADALASNPAEIEEPRARNVSRLLLLRSTLRTRAIVAAHADVVAAAYPARAIDAYAALVGEAAWSGDALLWCRVEAGLATVLDRPPRGIRVGR